MAILDNESSDASFELYAALRNKPVIRVHSIPYRGSVCLTERLEAKRDLCAELDHDWVIHHDADEILEHCKPGRTLRDAVEEADAAGHNVLNFDEFVFVPELGSDYSDGTYYSRLLRYYFFEPGKCRLNRAWKRTAQVSNLSSGGHCMQGSDLSISPVNHILRHYIVLSQRHALEKYLHIKFDPAGLAKGWHGNRLNFTESKLRLPEHSEWLFRLPQYDSKEFCRDRPCAKHFWQWERDGAE